MATHKRARLTTLFIRIQFSNGERFGPGKAALLAAIDRSGSISAAARSMRMSYRRAWLLVDSTNRLFGRATVKATPGGRAGGGASLTPFGRSLVSRYNRMLRAIDRGSRRDLAVFDRWVAGGA
jgi:molybdate transport system regulatory protein